MAKGVILLAAGGTGGHLFPAEALAHELIERGWKVHLATDRRAERYSGQFPAADIHAIPSATLGSKNPVAVISAFWKIWQGVREAGRIIARIKPEAVVGFGGYPTLPPLYAATRRKVPTLIHEQNAVMGRANKALAGRVDAIAGGFLPESESADGAKTVTTGNPVRPQVLEAAKTPYTGSNDGGPFRLLVFGGSQGAQFFSDAVPAAVALLPQDLRKRLVITQQARAEDVARVKAAYAELGVGVQVSPFFTDMAGRMAEAHLVMSRSGASTVSEIAVIGRPALLVPYPHALDHDQAANAAALAAAGGAELHLQSTLSAERIAQLVGALMQDPDRLVAMASAARSAGKPNAARLLADLTEAIASGKTVSEYRRTRA
ncbi:MAG: undecaprenyldiphospho-muramoylpentapeptide beta-N-acetylglucosaminyltransferase [Mesorhizobium sp.]|jgi:UDP-N-acetylglucosamine--N-acetylmuramyl-(pentapeptide) pyrophosphoryl-undecaprenol N-acetylglucosamine transferase|uniref:undecaprenyldiphospho-muramoylpentapeptide beta-N-acetylglucosaminyltransferase n=3 Tax=Mesorhizobium sp. TaxID=1871066 RepID=UPI000FE412D5|nr:undecaprenyldiphospho-muramoylpentapeptide beta-N-acetylglucosaminyltransferase [Mesorhizobium sp.]RWH73758.1 MAG: undecaprenyldiphospho-muramoylpentapeptide beta-N-acetylglucosaminyltransferase [Mesorhizobium sp.]RWL31115.1 MAG: undecaprenyldiphospho-muramoylpentapeptide beta-N-acetylglucosaminyltransferase [Mesorhizobium sp.]RWL36823.1 MAG: undecaprenyldiphospho-muramoylpentapeptide beta-N-acetylglucosaminyltransferase [Mesorhizobium sp.]RWL40417.1 MAG: undecaprenyldiphospho-muramoylpentap